MEQETTAGSGKRWNMVERIKGDKVVWMVVLLLIMISMITISGSTSLLAIDNNTHSRISCCGYCHSRQLLSVARVETIIELHNH